MDKKFQEPDIIATLQKHIETFMNEVFTKSQENIAKRTPRTGQFEYESNTRIWDTGFLAKSGKPPKWKGNECVVKYTAPYAFFVEYGTDPHPINPKVLVGWARRKLGLSEKEANSVAYAIANKIRREGTQPHPFLRPAINEALKDFKINIVVKENQ